VTQSAVLALQLLGGEMISLEDAQENFPGITNVARTRARILSEKLEKQLLAKLMMMVEGGQLDPAAHIQMIRSIRKGKTLDAVFEEFVIKPQEEQAAGMLTSGLDGSQLLPGPAPAGELGPGGAGLGPQPPAAPDPA